VGGGGESVRNASAATFIGACGYKIQIPVHNQARGAINVGCKFTTSSLSFITSVFSFLQTTNRSCSCLVRRLNDDL
jgi:hypothetical protein